MVRDGLVTEVRELLSQGFGGNERPLQAIGYKETQDYLSGLLPSQEALVERIAISTRQLAKSQRTFFSKIHPKTSFHPLQEKERVLQQVLEMALAWKELQN